MAIFVGIDTFVVRANKDCNWKLQTISLFKTQIHYAFAFPAGQKNSYQQKTDQIKILHL